MRHESTFYCIDFDELGVVGKLALSAVERHQNHHQPTNIDAIHDHILNFGPFRQIFFDKKNIKIDTFW